MKFAVYISALLAVLMALPSLAQAQDVDPYDLYKQKQAVGEINATDPTPPELPESVKDPETPVPPIDEYPNSLPIIPQRVETEDEAELIPEPAPDTEAKIDADEIKLDENSAPEPAIETIALSKPGTDPKSQLETESTLETEISASEANPAEKDDLKVSQDSHTEETADKSEPLPAQDPLPARLIDADEGLLDNRADIAPFYLTAEEYVSKRGADSLQQTRLTYEVVTSPRAAGAKSQTRQVVLALGADFAAITTPSEDTADGPSLRILDFKLNRILDVSEPESGPPLFSNKSLYASAHRNTRMVATATNNGKKESVAAGPDTSLDAFWIESAMSWAMADRLSDIEAEEIKDGVAIRYKSKPVTEIRFDEEPYSDPTHSDALLAFAHHDWPIHPTILRQLFGAEAPVKFLTMVSISPQAPDGLVQTWTLKRRTYNPEPFPLDPRAVNAVHTQSASPLNFVINAAARQTAIGGRPTTENLEAGLFDAIEADEAVKAWLAGQRYIAHTEACTPNDARTACQALAEIETQSVDTPELEVLIRGFSEARSRKSRVEALKTLSPWIKDTKAPAIVLRVIGLTRAKIDAATARSAGVADIEALPLITEALVRDPYDQATYVGLAQYYAAIGDYTAAWDIYDALRAAIAASPDAEFGVERAETNLQGRAPGYFLPAVMAIRNDDLNDNQSDKNTKTP